MCFEPDIDSVACEENRDFHKAIYNWCVRQMTHHRNKGNNEQAVRWGVSAAAIAAGNGSFGIFSDPSLEEVLLSIGRNQQVFPRKKTSRLNKTYLHVLSEAYPFGGHTRLCRRWIEGDSTNSRHHVIITSQRGPLPEDLRREVELQGGIFTVLDSTLSWMERATQLRKIACNDTDFVILHTHMADPLPVLAFAPIDVPPVLLLNHADHLYWLGVSVADLVVDIRASGQHLTKSCRGIENTIILPIPLGKEEGGSNSDGHRPEQKKQERSKMGIPEDAVVFLTIGSEYKYEPMGDYDFINTAEQILEQCPTAYLIVVGPRFGGRWAVASEKHGGRLKALGGKEDVTPFHAVADIYLEGFPFGSLTALLEAGLAGLPCVGAPATTPLPFRSDDMALSSMSKPNSSAEYISEAVRLASDADVRCLVGKSLQAEIRKHHCGSGWSGHLAQLHDRMPEKHSCGSVKKPHQIPLDLCNYWMAFQWNRKKIDFAEIYKLIYQKAEWQGFPLVGSVDKKFDKDLYAFAKRLKKRTGESYIWLCEICADNGLRAFAIKDRKSLARSLLRSMVAVPGSFRNRGLFSLLARSLLGSHLVEQLKGMTRYFV